MIEFANCTEHTLSSCFTQIVERKFCFLAFSHSFQIASIWYTGKTKYNTVEHTTSRRDEYLRHGRAASVGPSAHLPNMKAHHRARRNTRRTCIHTNIAFPQKLWSSQSNRLPTRSNVDLKLHFHVQQFIKLRLLSIYALDFPQGVLHGL